MRKIRFIHASDLHLGSYLHTVDEAGENNDLFNSATYRAFSRICDKAIELEVDFLVISGDVFDREARSIAAWRYFNKECLRLKGRGIPVFMIAGNHDPIREQRGLLDFPSNVHIFGSEEVEVKEVKCPEGITLARIFGRSYRDRALSEKIHKYFNPPDEGVWNIGLMHTQLDPSDKNYIPCSLKDLSSVKGIHYWALGHIHKCRILQKADPAVAFSGIPQGRDFGETGSGGCLLVELKPGENPQINFLPVSQVIFTEVEVRIDEDPEKPPRNIPDIVELIRNKSQELIEKGPGSPEGFESYYEPEYAPECYTVRWVLKGRGEIHDLFQEQDAEELVQDLVNNLRNFSRHESPFIWTDSVIIRTGSPLLEYEELKGSNQLIGEIEEVIRLCKEDEEKRKELQSKLGSVFETGLDHEKIDETRVQLNDRMLDEIIEQARQLVLEKLLLGREQN